MIVMGIDEGWPWAMGWGRWWPQLLSCATRFLASGDSKLLTAKRRQQLADEILAYSYVGVGWVQAEEIDQLGLTAAKGGWRCAVRWSN